MNFWKKRLIELLQTDKDTAGVNIKRAVGDSVTTVEKREREKREKLKNIIKNEWLQKEYNPFEENDFPRRNIDLDAGDPKDDRSITPAYQSTKISTDNTAETYDKQTAGSQLSKDLQETVEIKLSPEIKDLARNLDYNPVKIYEHVKNNFDYEPYYGSVKGAKQTLWQQGGNDFD